MRSILRATLVAAMVTAAIPALAQQAAPAAPAQGQQAPRQPPMTMTVPAYPDGGMFPVEYSQAAPGVTNGGGVSPEINWQNTPDGTQSFVISLHDLDVASKKTTDDQVHWLVWNIPGTATGLPKGVPAGATLPDGTQQISVSGPYYRGPGAGANGPFHHYIIELYALDTKLDVQPAADAFATRHAVMDAMQGHVIGKISYSALFKRPS